MSFRHKLLTLLLVVALVPLLINGLLHRTTMHRISQKLTTETREALQDNTTRQLQALVHNQSLLLKRDRAFILQALDAQAREIEDLLIGEKAPAGAELTASYFLVQKHRPEFFLWHATFLESGQTSILPANALSSSVEPLWYRTTRETRSLSWQFAFVDSQLQIIASKPVFLQNGELVGITAISLNYQQLFNDWQLPQPWEEEGRLFIVTIEPQASGITEKLSVLFEIIDRESEPVPTLSTEQLMNKAVTTSDFSVLIEDIEQNRSGVQALEFDSRKSLWFYAPTAIGDAFPLLIIPYDLVSLPARQAADYVQDQFINGLKLTALLSVGVLLWVIITAIFRARTVTKPVTDLVRASEQLSQGDFSTQVSIHTNDEFEALGAAFNRIGPQLKERQDIKQSLAVAKDIQQLILPLKAPSLENFEIAARIDYCDETGGDYYDFIETESGKWGLAVGDVVGHGVGAALLMASAAGILHAAIANGQENLEALFSSLNNFLEKDVGDTRFMTLFFALLDPSEQSLQWLSAGHGPIFLYRAPTGSVEELPATTMPLGIMDDVDFSSIQKETLTIGDILAIGTDGIWETINPSGEMFGEERFARLLQQLSQQQPDEIISEILLAVEAFRGDALKGDDLTLLILKAK